MASYPAKVRIVEVGSYLPPLHLLAGGEGRGEGVGRARVF